MSIKAITRVWDNSKMKGSGLLLLVALADNADEDGVCWPGVDYLADKIRMSARQSQRLLDLAEQRGELYRKVGVGRGNRSLYLITTGLNREQISSALYANFDLSPQEADEATRLITEKVTSGAIKGDISERQQWPSLLHWQTADEAKRKTTTVIEPSESTDRSPSTEILSVSQTAKTEDEASQASLPIPVASPIPTPALTEGKDPARTARCWHCNAERTWTEHLQHIWRCDVCGSLVHADMLWPAEKTQPSAYKVTGKKNDDEGFSKRGRKPTWYVFKLIDGKNVHLGPAPTEKAARELIAAGDGTMTSALPEGATALPWPKKERQPNAWDVLGEAIATHLFGAKDKAGINAVYGRIGPILHGDKRSGRCEGIIAYECEKQGKDKAELDYKALADMVPKFMADYRRANPQAPQLKDCAKVLDNWQAWRGKGRQRRLEDMYEPVPLDDWKPNR